LIAACPRCQAPIAIEEGLAAVACPGCKVPFLTGRHTHPLQVVVAPTLETGDALRLARAFLRAGKHRATWVGRGRWRLLPYWRYRTKAFQWVEGLRRGPPGAEVRFHDLEVRSLDFLIPAAEAAPRDLLPRPGIFTAYPMTPEVLAGATPTEVTVAVDAARVRARSEVELRTDITGARILRRDLSLVGEEMLLVHLPFFSLEYRFHSESHVVLVDGILGEATTRPERTEESEPAARATPSLSTQSLLLPLTCPACAADLRLAAGDRIHPCATCGRAWEIEDGQVVEVRQYVALTASSAADVRYLPFWVIGVHVHGFSPTQTAKDGDSDESLTVYVPAFESWQIEKLSHLGVRLTRSHPQYAVEEPGPGASLGGLTLEGATLGSEDAEHMARVILGALASTNPSTFSQFLDAGVVTAESAELHWLPFRPSGLYLHDPISGARVREMSGSGEPLADPTRGQALPPKPRHAA
jgi:hypothetical protein